MLQHIVKLYKFSENIWFRLPEKLRFLLVGGFNTVLAYAVVNLLDLLIKYANNRYNWGLADEISANIALVIQYAITINISFLTMRYYVFRSKGNWQKEWVKTWSVYIFIYAINAPIMTLLMVICGLPLWQAQAIYLTFSTIITFL